MPNRIEQLERPKDRIGALEIPSAEDLTLSLPPADPDQVPSYLDDPNVVRKRAREVFKFSTETGVPLPEAEGHFQRMNRKPETRQYEGFWDEVSRGMASGSLNVGSGLLHQANPLLAYHMRQAVSPFGMSKENYQKYLGITEQARADLDAESKRVFIMAQDPKYAAGEGWRGFVANAIGQAFPYMAASVGVTLLSGTPAAAFGVAYAVEGSAAYHEAIAAGATEEQARMEELLVGTINGSIEILQVNKIFKFARGSRVLLKKAVKESVLEKIVSGGAQLTIETLKLAVQEGLQEGAQEVTGILVKNIHGEWVPLGEAGPQVLKAILGGAVVGPFFGGAGRIAKTVIDRGAKPAKQVRVLMDETSNKLREIDKEVMAPPGMLLTPEVKARIAEGIEKRKQVYKEASGKLDALEVETREVSPGVTPALQKRIAEGREQAAKMAKPEGEGLRKPTEAKPVAEDLFGTRNQYKDLSQVEQMERVLTDKPAYLRDPAAAGVPTTEEMQTFAQENNLVIGKKEGALVVAQNQKALDAVIAAEGGRELGLALGYQDITPGAKPGPQAIEAPPESPPTESHLKSVLGERKTKAEKEAAAPPKAPERDVLGGAEPLQQIHKALKEAKAIRPLTEAEKRAVLKKRVGAAAGTLRSGVKAILAGELSASDAVRRSTGKLKGQLTEKKQIYESIKVHLEESSPGAIDAAGLSIIKSPKLRYFEVVNTTEAFDNLINGMALTYYEIDLLEAHFGKSLGDIARTRLVKASLVDRLTTIWRAGLLTGIKTSGLNLFANVSHGLTETGKDVPTVAIDVITSLVTGERAVGLTLRGYPKGFVEGAVKGWQYMKTGVDERNIAQKYDYSRFFFGASKFAKGQQTYTELMFHLMGAADQPFYYGALSHSLYSQAIAQGRNKGLKGKEFHTFMKELAKSPTDEMLRLAAVDAETAVFQNKTHLGDLGKAIQEFPGGRFVVPFSRTPSAVAMQIIHYSPIGAISEINDILKAKEFNQASFSRAMGRATFGTGAMWLGGHLLAKGLISLGYPDNERERELWKLEGRKPYSILMDNKWRSLHVLVPIGSTLAIGGYFRQSLEKQGSPTKAIADAITGAMDAFSDQTFVRNLNLALGAFSDPERKFEFYFTNLGGSIVPTIIADIARATDDTERRFDDPLAAIISRTPIAREGLEPRLDVFGQDLPRYGGNPLEVMIDPTRPVKIRQDILVDELRRLWDKDIKVSPTVLGNRGGFDILSDEENTVLWRHAGDMTYRGIFARLTGKIPSAGKKYYKELTDEEKGKIIEGITKGARDYARAVLVRTKMTQGVTREELEESGLLNEDVNRAWLEIQRYGTDPIESFFDTGKMK